jgi:TonB family protein
MEYYNQSDKKSRRYALAITLLLLLLLAILLSTVVFDVHTTKSKPDSFEIEFQEFEEPEEVVEETKPERPIETPQPAPEVRRDVTPTPVEEASIEQHEQTEGTEPETKTLNDRAMFKPIAGNVEEINVEEGNRQATQGERETNLGDKGGFSLKDEGPLLDDALSARGFRDDGEGPPSPNIEGYAWDATVVVRVEIDSDGNVISAQIEQRGSTSVDEKLTAPILKAAKQTKFKPSPVAVQAGRITYDIKAKMK